MELKCITGPCNGLYKHVDPHHRRGDIINVLGPREALIGHTDIDINLSVTQEYHQYKIEEFHGPQGQSLKFLIPAYADVWNLFCKFFK